MAQGDIEQLDVKTDEQRGKYACGPAKDTHNNPLCADRAINFTAASQERGKYASGPARRMVEHDRLRGSKYDKSRNVRIKPEELRGR